MLFRSKKYKVTATGKLLRRVGNQSHNLEHKSPLTKQQFNKDLAVDKSQERNINRLLGKA